MSWSRRDWATFFGGSVLLGLVSAGPLVLLLGSSPRLYPAPDNAWLAPAYLVLLGGSFITSVILLLRRVHPGYCVWAHAVLSFLIFIAYYGFLRREDSFRHYPDPDAPVALAPVASVSGVVLLALMALALAVLPHAIKALLRWLRGRRRSTDGSPDEDKV